MLGRSSFSISGSWKRRCAKRDYFFPGTNGATQSKIRDIVPGRIILRSHLMLGVDITLELKTKRSGRESSLKEASRRKQIPRLVQSTLLRFLLHYPGAGNKPGSERE